VKAPLVPFHGWLPDAYREAPAEVSAILSGVLSKVAAYGFLRVVVTKADAPGWIETAILVVAIVTLLYGSLVAFRAPDFRGVVAYSSVAQMGLITLGVFAVTDAGLDGAVLQMVAHGLVSAALFLLAGCVEARAGTGSLSALGGMARGRPLLATVLMTTGIIALAVPGSATFAGEFLILRGVLDRGWAYTLLGAVAIVLAAMYMLRLISAVLHRDRGHAVPEGTRDLRVPELGILLPLVGLLLALSVWPAAVSERSFPGDQADESVTTQFDPALFTPGGSPAAEGP
jgi:NADH-quinone oxidoreductase subunit M